MVALRCRTTSATCVFAAVVVAGAADAQSPARLKFAALPTAEDIAMVYPAKAQAERVGGRVVVSCAVTAEAALTGCAVKTETPQGYGFGAVAVTIAQKIRLEPGDLPAQIDLPLRFEPPAPPEREPTFKTGPSEYRFLGGPGPYYPERAERMNISGEAVVDCKVSDKGRLNACVVVSETPPETGFAEASLKMAQVGWMKAAPRVVDGAPVADEWVRVRVPFRVHR